VVHLKGEGTVLVRGLTGLAAPRALSALTSSGVPSASVDTQESEWQQTDSGAWQECEEALAARHWALVALPREASALNILVQHGPVEHGSFVQVRHAGDERLMEHGTTWPSCPCRSLAKMPSWVSSSTLTLNPKRLQISGKDGLVRPLALTHALDMLWSISEAEGPPPLCLASLLGQGKKRNFQSSDCPFKHGQQGCVVCVQTAQTGLLACLKHLLPCLERALATT
jgi:hypothetical protein